MFILFGLMTHLVEMPLFSSYTTVGRLSSFQRSIKTNTQTDCYYF